MTIRVDPPMSDDVARRIRSGRSVLVTGAAGIGKTTVLRAACGRLAEDGRGSAPCRFVHAATSATASEMPLAAFAHHLVAGAATPVERLGSALATLAADSAILVIDDAHHLDPESAVLVQHLVATRATVLMAQRDGLTLPDALARLVRDGDVDVVHVQPLDREAAIRLVEHHLGGLLDVASAELLHRASGGNPLYLQELLIAAQSAGQLTRDAGVWTLDRLTVQGSLAELITERMAGWTADVRAVAELVAAGSAVPVDVVAAIAGRAAVTAATAAGLVRPRAADGHLELHHPLVTEVLRGELGHDQLTARLSSLVSAALDAPVADPTTLAAWLAVLAEQAPVDASRLVAAAELLIDQARPHAALRLAEVALRIDESAATGVFVRASAQLGRAVASDDPDLAVRAARGAVEALTFGIGTLDNARQALAAAAMSGPDELSRAELEALGLVAELICGGAVPRSIDRLLEIDRLHSGQLAALIAAAGVGTALVGAGRHLDGVELYDRYDAALVTSAAETAYHRLQFALNKVEAYLGAGHTDLARIHVDERLRRIEGADAPTALVFGGAADAQLMIAAGRPADAARHLGQVLAVLGPLDSAGIRTWAMCTLDWCCAWAGIPGPDEVPDHPNEQGRLVFPLARLARATADAERGKLATARDQAITLATECAASGHAGTALNAWHLAGRIQPSATIAQHAARIAADCQGELPSLVSAHITALHRGDSSALADVAAGFVDLERPALAHEAYLQAARAAADEGRRSRATTCQARAVDVLAAGTRPTFASRLGAGAIAGVQLTTREHEIAVAAATGASNAAIAEQLGISRRTVETHLQAVYRKVGVSDRTTLAALLS